MDPVQLALLTLLLGLVLIVLEVFLPTGGTFAILAVTSLGFSCFMAWKAWHGTHNTWLWTYYGCVLAAIPMTVIGTLYIMPHTSLGKRILLQAPDLADVTPDVEEQEKLKQLIGAFGITKTPVRPGGMVEVAGERFHCESRGLLIETGKRVEVLSIRGNRLLVKEATNQPEDVATAIESVSGKVSGGQAPQPADSVGSETSADEIEADQLSDTREDSKPENSLDFDIPTN